MRLFGAFFLAIAAHLVPLSLHAETQPAQYHIDGVVASISGNDFAQFTQSGIVIVDFYADWCGPCKKLKPMFDQLAQSYKGQVKFAKLNIDHARPLANKYAIQSIPTVILFKDGKEIKRHGPGSKQDFIRWIEAAL